MASLIDVAMAQHDASVSEEERKMQKKIEDSKTIKALDTFTAMNRGAQIGLNMYDMGANIKSAAQGFKYRKDTRRGYIDKQVEGGMSKREARQSWRNTGKPEALKQLGNARSYASQMQEGGSSLSKSTLVSMYLEGTNSSSVVENTGTGEKAIVSDKENGTNVNIGSYTDVQNLGAAAGAAGDNTIKSNERFAYGPGFGGRLVQGFFSWRNSRKNQGGGAG
tara:strand:- start:6838 stop:7500 length:663 start_codon:yes stop_codon:yes gene_type:complete